MALRPIKAIFIKGARGFITIEGTPGLRLYPKSGEAFEIAFEAKSIPIFLSMLEQLKSALAAGERGTLH